MHDKLIAIIPAGGCGHRMKSYGPKCLTSLGGGDTVLSRQLDILRKYNAETEIILVLGFEAEKVYKFVPSNVRVVENQLYEETNVAYSINIGLKAASTEAR